ncbi:unnamed protein product [Ceutorhynchus assimilis]|uniref:Uncharacterized protein n=1 Tax=Ceutorhynchus assimilis TaxID=467358 RepID=A0A9N9QSH9_9CUCU|nr:unnamed protein product [Ceutorhynchus assimilis]
MSSNAVTTELEISGQHSHHAEHYKDSVFDQDCELPANLYEPEEPMEETPPSYINNEYHMNASTQPAVVEEAEPSVIIINQESECSKEDNHSSTVFNSTMIDLPSVSLASCFTTSFMNNLENELDELELPIIDISQIVINQDKDTPINAQMFTSPDLDIIQVVESSDTPVDISLTQNKEIELNITKPLIVQKLTIRVPIMEKKKLSPKKLRYLNRLVNQLKKHQKLT